MQGQNKIFVAMVLKFWKRIENNVSNDDLFWSYRSNIGGRILTVLSSPQACQSGRANLEAFLDGRLRLLHRRSQRVGRVLPLHRIFDVQTRFVVVDNRRFFRHFNLRTLFRRLASFFDRTEKFARSGVSKSGHLVAERQSRSRQFKRGRFRLGAPAAASTSVSSQQNRFDRNAASLA